MKKKVPIGISDFRKIIEGNYYYVDKSLFIQEILETPAEVIILPRPRRFGKTLNLSMLRTFLSQSVLNPELFFKDLLISGLPDCMKHCGKYPVIFVTLKDIGGDSFEESVELLALVLANLYEEHQELLDSDILSTTDKKQFNAILSQEASKVQLGRALFDLSRYLYKVHGQKIYVLIDEYDSPIHDAFHHGYYDEAIKLYRRLFSPVLKDNPYLKQGVITGILRVSKESIFSGLNNPEVDTLLDRPFSRYFGLLEEEVLQILDFFELQDSFEEVKEWYNGYLFGEEVVYNPWSVINYIRKSPAPPAPYWLNTSSNELIYDQIKNNIADLHGDLDKLLQGEGISYPVTQNVVFRDLKANNENIWSFFLFSGYLKAVSWQFINNRQIHHLKIPNQETRLFFEETVTKWLSKDIGSNTLLKMLGYLVDGNVDEFLAYLKELVLVTFSVHDTRRDYSELAYHMFMMGLMINLGDRYHVRSNRESGLGRYDMMLEPKTPKDPGFIFEFKRYHDNVDKSPEDSLNRAMEQIQSCAYITELQARKIRPIHSIALVFKGKNLYTKHVVIVE